MQMSPDELNACLALSARPYLEGGSCCSADIFARRSWRYVIEINSACNLRCALCFAGNQQGYQYQKGVMPLSLLSAVLDKAKTETPSGGVVCAYANSEPLLYPELPAAARIIKEHGFRLEISSNLNYMDGIDQVLCAGPDLFTVSVSGWTQYTYSRAHRGGDIEKVKANLRKLAEIWRTVNPNVAMGVSYHMYRYNLGELHYVAELCAELGFQLLLSWARPINLENTIQAIRTLEQGVEPGQPLAPLPGVEWLPPANPEFVEHLKHISFPPQEAAERYAKWPIADCCAVADLFTYVRYDGAYQLCAWCDDRRLVMGNYLEMSPDQMREIRCSHPFCKECRKRKLNLLFHIVEPSIFNM